MVTKSVLRVTVSFNIKVILFFNQLLNYSAVFSPVCLVPFVDRVSTKLDLSSSNQFRLNANRLALFSKHAAQTLEIMLPMKLNDLLVVPRHRGRKSVKSKLSIAKKMLTSTPIPNSQLVPEKPSLQRHWYALPSSKHWPPFWQGFESHGLARDVGAEKPNNARENNS